MCHGAIANHYKALLRDIFGSLIKLDYLALIYFDRYLDSSVMDAQRFIHLAPAIMSNATR
jgi:hypothetical protein